MKAVTTLAIIILSLPAQAFEFKFEKACEVAFSIDTDTNYNAISAVIIDPLRHRGFFDYADKLENEIIVEGSKSLSEDDCLNLGKLDNCLSSAYSKNESGLSSCVEMTKKF